MKSRWILKSSNQKSDLLCVVGFQSEIFHYEIWNLVVVLWFLSRSATILVGFIVDRILLLVVDAWSHCISFVGSLACGISIFLSIHIFICQIRFTVMLCLNFLLHLGGFTPSTPFIFCLWELWFTINILWIDSSF